VTDIRQGFPPSAPHNRGQSWVSGHKFAVIIFEVVERGCRLPGAASRVGSSSPGSRSRFHLRRRRAGLVVTYRKSACSTSRRAPSAWFPDYV